MSDRKFSVSLQKMCQMKKKVCVRGGGVDSPLHARTHTHTLFFPFPGQFAVTPIVSGEFSHHHRDRAAMAARVSLTQLRLEAEVDRYRAEGQWDRMPALVEQMAAAKVHEDGECLEGREGQGS